MTTADAIVLLTAALTEFGEMLSGVVLFLALALLPIILTVAMFVTKNSMLGFACAVFWAIFGGYCYTMSTVAWVDIYFYLAFTSLLGMVTFCALGAFGLREKRDAIGDMELAKGDGSFLDEHNGDNKDKIDELFSIDSTSRPSKRQKELYARAEARRSGTKKQVRVW